MKGLRNRRFGATALAGALAFLLWPSAAQAGVGFSVSPSNFRLKKNAGEAVSAKVTAHNKGSYAVTVTTEVTDMVTRTGEDGFSVRDEAPAGTTPHSCARWIQLAQQGPVTISPGESAVLEFVVSPPPEIEAGGYGAYLFFIAKPAEAPPEAPQDKPEIRLVTIPRLGVSVIYEVAGTIRRAGELTQLEFTPPDSSHPLRVRHGFVNTGNAETVLSATFHILDAQGLLVGKGSLKTLKTFPGETGTMETLWDQTLPSGRYSALITFEIGPDAEEAIVRELEFEVP